MQKPLATVVIGGLISATLLTLIILPVFYVFFSSGKIKTEVKKSGWKVVSNDYVPSCRNISY